MNSVFFESKDLDSIEYPFFGESQSEIIIFIQHFANFQWILYLNIQFHNKSTYFYLFIYILNICKFSFYFSGGGPQGTTPSSQDSEKKSPAVSQWHQKFRQPNIEIWSFFSPNKIFQFHYVTFEKKKSDKCWSKFPFLLFISGHE